MSRSELVARLLSEPSAARAAIADSYQRLWPTAEQALGTAARTRGSGSQCREWPDGPGVVDRDQAGYRAAADRESEQRARRRADVSAAIQVVTERQGFFTPKTLAAYLALSERTVRQVLADSAIPSYRIAGSRPHRPQGRRQLLAALQGRPHAGLIGQAGRRR